MDLRKYFGWNGLKWDESINLVCEMENDMINFYVSGDNTITEDQTDLIKSICLTNIITSKKWESNSSVAIEAITGIMSFIVYYAVLIFDGVQQAQSDQIDKFSCKIQSTNIGNIIKSNRIRFDTNINNSNFFTHVTSDEEEDIDFIANATIFSMVAILAFIPTYNSAQDKNRFATELTGILYCLMQSLYDEINLEFDVKRDFPYCEYNYEKFKEQQEKLL